MQNGNDHDHLFEPGNTWKIVLPITTKYIEGNTKCFQPLEEVKGFLTLTDETRQWNIYLYDVDKNLLNTKFLSSVPKTMITSGLVFNQDYRNAILLVCDSLQKSGGTKLSIQLAFQKLEREHFKIKLTYQHRFNQFRCKTSKDGKCIVLITGNYTYGFKKYHYEKCDQYLDVISLQEDGFHHTSHELLNNLAEDMNIFDVGFNSSETSILLASDDNRFVLYSLVFNEFGKVFKWDRNICYYSYFQYFDCGNLLFLACEDGETFIVYERNSVFYKYKKLSLNWKKDLVKPVVAVCGGRFRSIASIYSRGKIYLYDLHQEKFVAELKVPNLIIDQNQTWISTCKFGEVIFVFGKDECSGQTVVHVYILKDENISLNHLARKVVLNVYSREFLKAMDLPGTLI